MYNSSITTRIIDPVFDLKTLRTEFRLQPNAVYLSNFRLINVGFEGGTKSYLGPLGALGCIDSMQLYDNNTLLDQLLDASIWNTFNGLNKENAYNISMSPFLSHANVGYLASGNQQMNDSSNDTVEGDILIRTQADKDEVKTGSKAWIDLKKMLPFLDYSISVPTSVYKNLRLVVNWKTPAQLKDVAVDRSVDYSVFEGSALIVDEVVDDKIKQGMMRDYNGVSYRPIEHDSVNVPAISPGVATEKEQNNSFNIKGFDNKTLHRLLMVQTPQNSVTFTSGTDTIGFGNQGSTAQWKPEYQLRVNGSNVYPGSGVQGKNRRLALTTDTFGTLNLVPGQNLTGMNTYNDFVEDSSLIGTADYTGLRIEAPINELIVDFNRYGYSNDNPSINQQLRLNFFGEVDKRVDVNGDTYSVLYD